MKKQNRGFSLISLIITIIVIITIAAVVIFSGMGTPEKAQLSAIISDIDNVQTAVDQAYYGFYTEKSVAGEVWTKSQFYEAVATGETNRDNLTGTGIIPISDGSMVKMTLPKYEGRTWGVAVEDIDNHTQVGSVVLLPGYETDGKIYATLLDVQSDGRDAESMEEAMQKVSGKGGNQQKELTEEEKTFLANLNLGLQINYLPDKKKYVATAAETGWIEGNQELETEDAIWKILDINMENGDILITTCGPVNNLGLSQAVGYVNGPTILDKICKSLYSNEKALQVRSLTLRDIDKICEKNPDEIETNYGTLQKYTSGKFYTYYENEKNKTELTPKIATVDNPVNVMHTFYHYVIDYGFGKLLGEGYSWLASQSVNLKEDRAEFGLGIMGDSAIWRPTTGLEISYFTNCSTILNSADNAVGCNPYGLRPVVKINVSSLSSDDIILPPLK